MSLSYKILIYYVRNEGKRWARINKSILYSPEGFIKQLLLSQSLRSRYFKRKWFVVDCTRGKYWSGGWTGGPTLVLWIYATGTYMKRRVILSSDSGIYVHHKICSGGNESIYSGVCCVIYVCILSVGVYSCLVKWK